MMLCCQSISIVMNPNPRIKSYAQKEWYEEKPNRVPCILSPNPSHVINLVPTSDQTPGRA
jgi:hypothetical protein